MERSSWLSSEGAEAEASVRDDPGFKKLLEHSLQTRPRSCLTHATRESISALAAWCAVFLGIGAESGFTSQPLSRHRHSERIHNSDENSWKEWIPAISMASGCVLSACLLSIFGRRRPLIFISIPLLLRWLLVVFFQHPSIKLTGNVIGAMCSGFIWTLAPIYVGEISDPKRRGCFLALLALTSSMGALFTHAAEMLISRIFLAKIFACSSVCIALISFFSLESPFWLIAKGRRVDGIKVFGLLRGYQILAIKELKHLLDIETESFARSKYLKCFSLFKRQVFKSTAVVIIYNTFSAFCGLHFLDLYSQRFFSTISAKEWKAADIQVTFELLKSSVLVLSCILCKKYSRRSICIWSCVCIFITSLVSVGYFIVTSHKPVAFILWIPFTCFIGYSLALTVGLIPMSWVLPGELLPLEARGISSCICNCLSLVAVFAATKSITMITSLTNSTVLYVMYGLTGLIFAFVINSVLFETKGSTLIEIGKKYKRSSANY